MTLILSGTDGLSDVDGSAATPAIRGTDANTGIFFPAADTIAFSEGGVESMRIDSSGNVGIGTVSPAVKLHVSGQSRVADSSNASNYMSFGVGANASYGNASISTTTAGLSIVAEGAGNMTFLNNGSERMRIDSSGNVGIGTSSPAYKLDVSGVVKAGALQASGTAAGSFSANAWFIQAEEANVFRSYACGTTGNAAYAQWQHYSAKSGGTAILVFTANNGSFAVAGALSKGSGSFRIDHPLPQLEETHQLVHSFIEGPQADLIYRGKVNLVNGSATVNIDTASTMTEGTFVALCRDVQCFTTNESDWTAVRGSVSGNILTIEAEDNTSTASISWMVIGERQDKHMLETGWTDENGKVIVEPLKDVNTQLQADVAALQAPQGTP